MPEPLDEPLGVVASAAWLACTLHGCRHPSRDDVQRDHVPFKTNRSPPAMDVLGTPAAIRRTRRTTGSGGSAKRMADSSSSVRRLRVRGARTLVRMVGRSAFSTSRSLIDLSRGKDE